MAETWFTPKEWKARLVEFAGRRLLRNVANGESTTYDVSRSEGQVSQEGDAFNTKKHERPRAANRGRICEGKDQY